MIRQRRPCTLPAVGLLALAGCTLQELDLVGRACPCGAGWTCEPATKTCVEGALGAGASPDAGAIDVVSFKADWATPNAIRWSWELQGEAEDFYAFRIALGTSLEEVEAQSHVVTGTENPELDRFALPRTTGDDPVRGSITYGLDPNTVYHARLMVVDTANHVSRSANVAQQRTALAPIGAIDIMVDGPPPTLGFTNPSCMKLSPEAYAGAQAYEYQNHCVEGPDGKPTPSCEALAKPLPLCWQNMFLEGMQIPIDTAQFPSGAFDEAYLEFAVRIDDSQNAWWGQTGIRAGAGDLKTMGALTFRADGAYRLYQIKLDALPLDYAELAVGGLSTFFVGGPWDDGATVRFDEVRIRW